MLPQETETYNYSLREAVQSPPKYPNPPPHIDWQATGDFIAKELPNLPDLTLEFPAPNSCPTQAHQLRKIISDAPDSVRDRLAIHTVMDLTAVELAIACGAQKVLVFQDVNRNIHGRVQDITALLSNLSLIANQVQGRGINLRASLERATHNWPFIGPFVEGIEEINQSTGSPVKFIGIPDTNGDSYPVDYKRAVELINSTAHPSRVLSVHLHDDAGRALENLQMIRETSHKRLWIDFVPDPFPGERTGTRPTITDLEKEFPSSLGLLVQGLPWVDDPEAKLHTHVAGVHNHPKDIDKYGSGKPASGGYPAVGKGNVLAIAPDLDDDLAAKIALAIREYTARLGNQPQSFMDRMVTLGRLSPKFISDLTDSFGPQPRYLENPLPNLTPLQQRLADVKLGV